MAQAHQEARWPDPSRTPGSPVEGRDGGGLDGGSGIYFANAGDDVHAVSFAPLAPVVGCVVLRPDGTRVLARVERDPLAQPKSD